MKLLELLSLYESHNWETLQKETVEELTELLGEISFKGGYCFHLALALMMKAKDKDVIIIADNGHAAAFDQRAYISIDYKGVHKGESALNERVVKTFAKPDTLIRAVSKGWASPKQIEDLKKVKEQYKK